MTLARLLHRIASTLRAALGASLFAVLLGPAGAATTDLADQPLFSSPNVPGNLLFALSVEWPTASTPAYPSTAAYAAGTTYVGYFDPAKCYRYNYDSAVPANSYFAPSGVASAHACGGGAWSGNYLNWASTQTLDAFRWALTGGPRSVDTATTTILEKTYHAGQGDHNSIYPDKVLAGGIGSATPFDWSSVVSWVHGLGTAMYFGDPTAFACTFSKDAITNITSVNCSYGGNANQCAGLTAAATSCSAAGRAATATTPAIPAISCNWSDAGAGQTTYGCTSTSTPTACSVTAVPSAVASDLPTCNRLDLTNAGAAPGSFYRVFVRIKACDTAAAARSPSVPLEQNCKQYGANAKPEGLVQQYSMKLRYSDFGYLNDDNVRRDGGVMRARMAYVGPQKPVPGSTSVANATAEWDATTGVLNPNPAPADASATQAAAAAAGYTVPVTTSGVINYLNNFGKVVIGPYKSNDPVSELYYAGLRYYKHLGNVASYSDLTRARNAALLTKWIDGFPVITDWDDPMLYSCQQNFILGIGDVNTHADANLNGSTIRSFQEPALPGAVAADGSVNVKTATDMVGKLEGIGNLGSYSRSNNNSYFIAGLAYDSHTKDIRPDLPADQFVATYWLDVMEGQTYVSKNQYWLAAKYGGFTVPQGFDTYAGSNGPSTLTPDSLWHTTADMTGADKRPDNYFLANQADRMLSGLTSAFAKISREANPVTSTAFATSGAKISSTGSASYASSYDPKDWSGGLVGSSISINSNGDIVMTPQWDAGAKLDARAPGSRKIVTCCSGGGGALPFTAGSLGGTALNPRTDYASFAAVPGVSSQSQANYVAYLRGDRSQEVQNGGVYRDRIHVLGDIVGSKLNPVGPPGQPYFDATNPGYSAFRRAQSTRPTVVYVGANDGMMHAFGGTLPTGAATCTTCGDELFAYVPSFAYTGAETAATTGLASLGNPNYTHHYLVDATPEAFDVDFNRAGNPTGSGDWRTIVIGGLGKGGKGYYAIDVTDPGSWTSDNAVAGKVLWEFTDSRLGFTYGSASVVKTKKYGWVAIVTSGYNNVDGKGYFFFINPKTGALLEAVATPEGSTASRIEMAEQTAYVPDYTDFTADAVYAGDLLGNVWRLDLTPDSGNYAAPVKFAQLNAGVGQPVTTRPLIEVAPNSKKRYLLVGTGRLLADSDIDSPQQQSFYAIADGKGGFGEFYTAATSPVGLPVTRGALNANPNLLNGIGASPTSSMGWYYDLNRDGATGIAERINVTPTANSGVVLVGANMPNGDVCNRSGTSRAFGVTFDDGKTALVDGAGSPIAFSTASEGIITDVAFKDVAGRTTLGVGDSSGKTTFLKPPPPDASTLKRLNWREVPTVD